MNNFEILVRKQNVKFIYNLFKKRNIPIEHEHFKQIVYDEIMCKSTLDKYMKNVYSAYTYLLLNMKTMFDSTLISKYYYIMFKKEIDDELALKVVTAFYQPYNNDNIERSISFLHQLLYLFRELKEEEKYIISLSLFNYSLIYHGYKELTDIDLKEYTKEELIYKLSSTNTQTILMKVKIFETKARTIFEYNASSNQKIYLYTDRYGEVKLNFLGKDYFTGLALKKNSFSNICVVWDKIASGYYQTGGYNIKVYVDDEVYQTSSSNATFILNPKISIGNSQTKISDDYNNKSICPFDGLIVDIGIASRVLIKSEIDAHFNSVTDLINIKKYNKEGLLLEELVGESTHIYSYDTQDKIIKETINGEEINYTYDKERISTISCQGKTTTYQYDSKNQLIKSIKEGKINEYTYDNSGNITTKKENQNIINYEYDNRFRLIKYKNEEIEYDQESLLPKRCTIKKENGIIELVIDYTWVTNRLTQIIKTSGNNITKIEFEYDQEGRRTSKQVTQNNIERYRYE